MTRKPKLTGDAVAAAKALRGMGGYVCSDCGKEPGEDVNPYYCPHCHAVHCPFCEQHLRARCEHRLAHTLGETGRFPGVLPLGYTVPWIPVGTEFLLDPRPAHKRDFFGTAQALAYETYGRSLGHHPTPRMLVNALMLHLGAKMVANRSKDRCFYYFAPDANAARAKARQLISDVETGWRRLGQWQHPAMQWVEQVLPVLPNEAERDEEQFFDPFHAYSQPTLTFAPGKTRWLAQTQGETVWVWNVGSNAPPRRLADYPDEIASTLTFTPDGKSLSVSSVPKTATYDTWDGDGYQSVWNVETGQRVKRSEVRLSPLSPSPFSRGRYAQGYLHGGETTLIANGHIAYLLPTVAGANWDTLRRRQDLLDGPLPLSHRRMLDALALSPESDQSTLR